MRINVNNHHGLTSVHHLIIYQIRRSETMEQEISERKRKLTFEKEHNNPQMNAKNNISVRKSEAG